MHSLLLGFSSSCTLSSSTLFFLYNHPPALSSPCAGFLLHSLLLAFSSSCSPLLLHSPPPDLFSCTLLLLHSHHLALFLSLALALSFSCSLILLHSLPSAFSSSCTLSSSCSLVPYCTVYLLHSSLPALSSSCTHFLLHSFLLHSFSLMLSFHLDQSLLFLSPFSFLFLLLVFLSPFSSYCCLSFHSLLLQHSLPCTHFFLLFLSSCSSFSL
jgi:hypothetical protein